MLAPLMIDGYQHCPQCRQMFTTSNDSMPSGLCDMCDRAKEMAAKEAAPRTVYQLVAKGMTQLDQPRSIPSKRVFFDLEKATAYIPEFTKVCTAGGINDLDPSEKLSVITLELELQDPTTPRS